MSLVEQELYEPIGTLPIKGDRVTDTRKGPGVEVWTVAEIDPSEDFAVRFDGFSDNGARLSYFERDKIESMNWWRVLIRAALKPA